MMAGKKGGAVAFGVGMWQNAKQKGVEKETVVIEHDPIAYCQFVQVDGRVVAMEEHAVEDGISFFVSGEPAAIDMLNDGLSNIRYIGSESSVGRILLKVNGDG